MTAGFWSGRRVLLTGHTGFKGCWLALWLHSLKARTTGFALPAPPEGLFQSAEVESTLEHYVGDIRDLSAVRAVVRAAAPQVVFHLAAQPLVRVSYHDPLTTFTTNVQGTANILQAAVECDTVEAVVVVTSDKCYQNREHFRGYRENDPMGGDDPYSASKGCAELVTHSWRNSFCAGGKIASARAGNVIGGGDWADDRLVPDLIRSFFAGTPAAIRNPESVRPWQHVLEPLSGYLMLAERLCQSDEFAQGWNFGPDPHSLVSVSEVANRVVRMWGGNAHWEKKRETAAPEESVFLQLDSTKARERLQWRQVWTLERALEETVAWYKSQAAGEDMARITHGQIESYKHSFNHIAHAVAAP